MTEKDDGAGEGEEVIETKKFLILTILYGTGLGLIWWAVSWKAVLGVFIVCWTVRTELRFEGR